VDLQRGGGLKSINIRVCGGVPPFPPFWGASYPYRVYGVYPLYLNILYPNLLRKEGGKGGKPNKHKASKGVRWGEDKGVKGGRFAA
jgi:hypothetical protein